MTAAGDATTVAAAGDTTVATGEVGVSIPSGSAKEAAPNGRNPDPKIIDGKWHAQEIRREIRQDVDGCIFF
jgi:hypothetical protein